MDLSLKYLLFETGERYPMLVDSDGKPDFWFSLFITVVMRPKNATKTLEKVLSALKHLRRWECWHDRDLGEEFSQGRLLQSSDLHSIRDHAKLDGAAFESWVSQQKIVRSGKVKNLVNLRKHQPKPFLTVSNNHRAIRMSYIAEYLEFLAKTAMRTHHDFADLSPKIVQMVADFRALFPRKNSYSRNSGVFRTPANHAFQTYLEIAAPSSIDNPFKDPRVQLRHFLVTRLQFDLGLRTGEVLGLWVQDIEYGPENYIHIVRRHNHPQDPRLRQEVAKTNPRVLSLKDDLARLIHTYVVDVRSKIPEAQTHPLLFVSTASNGRGRPISSQALAQETKKVINARSDVLAGISRHQFRHAFTSNIKNELDARGVSGELQEPIVQYLLGHASPDSQAAYTAKHNQQKANRLVQEINRKRHGNAEAEDGKR